MSTYHFKTNINCIGCVTKIKPHLDKLEKEHSIEHWHVNMNDPDFTLKIETDKLTPEQVKHLISVAGFQAEITKAPRVKK